MRSISWPTSILQWTRKRRSRGKAPSFLAGSESAGAVDARREAARHSSINKTTILSRGWRASWTLATTPDHLRCRERRTTCRTAMARCSNGASGRITPLSVIRSDESLRRSSENVSGAKTVLSKHPSRMSCRESSVSPFESTKKRYCLWALTFVLAVVGICNLLLSITIIAVLRVSQGMEAMEVIPEESLVKFYGRTDLDKVCIQGGVCQGYGDEPVELTGDNSGVEVTVKNRRHDDGRANLRVQQNGTKFSSVESFEVKDSRTGSTFFTTDFPNFGLPSGVGRLAVQLAETHRIVSPVNSNLSFEANRQITMHGAESTRMESKRIVWMADRDVYIKSNDSVVLDAKKGIFLDATTIPLAPAYENSGPEVTQYKVCVCMPQGKLFRVPVPPGGNVRVNCARVSTSPADDPCQ